MWETIDAFALLGIGQTDAMPGGNRRSRTPAEYVIAGTWPDAELEPHKAARRIQTLARRLRGMMASRSLSANALAKASGVNRQVISNILYGSVWPDSLTVMDLEEALAAEIWPARGGSSTTAEPNAGWGLSADERVLGRFVLEPAVLRRMTVEHATILYWHVARFHAAAVGDMLRDLAATTAVEPIPSAAGKGLTVSDLASMELEEWLAHHLTACTKPAEVPAG
ncbi:helix-turn-helix domain-containing protein [Streptomyces sp. NPDC002746]